MLWVLKNANSAGFAADRRGSVALIFAVAAMFIFGIVGIAVDMGRSGQLGTKMQGALDAAVLAGANAPAGSRADVADAVFAANFIALNHLSSDNVTKAFTEESNGSFSGTATVSMPTTFAAIFQIPSMTIGLHAQAKSTATTTSKTTWDEIVTVTAAGAMPCVLVLAPTGASAFKMISNSNLNASTCEVDVRSDDTYAMYNDSQSQATFRNIRINGGVKHIGGGHPSIAASPNKVEVGKDGTGGLSAWVVKDSPTVNNDPFATAVTNVISSVTVGSCTAANSNKTLSGNVAPGTYCGITTFNGATFATGTYVIKSISGGNAGQLKITGASNGSAGVSFFLADNDARLTQYAAAEGSVLNAPTTGYTRGLLFFEAPGRPANWALSIASINKQSWRGLIYLPSANVTLKSLSEWPALYVSLVANTVYLDSLSSVFTPYPWTPWYQTTQIVYPGVTTTQVVSHEDDKVDVTSGWLQK